MEKELSELFESVKRAADAAEKSPGEEDRCLDVLKRLKKFPVNYQVLVSTQVLQMSFILIPCLDNYFSIRMDILVWCN